MISESTLAVAVRVALVGAVLFIAVPGAIWLAIKYVEFISWVGGL